MNYSAEISTSCPALFVFLIDESGSMKKKLSKLNKTKAELAADISNMMLYELVMKSISNIKVLDRFYVSLLGYGFDSKLIDLSDNISFDPFPISKIAQKPIRFRQLTKKTVDDVGNIFEDIIEYPIWVDLRVDNTDESPSALLVIT